MESSSLSCLYLWLWLKRKPVLTLRAPQKVMYGRLLHLTPSHTWRVTLFSKAQLLSQLFIPTENAV